MKTRAFALIAFSVLLGGCTENLGSVVSHGFCAPPDDPAECVASQQCDVFWPWEYVMSISQTNFVAGQMEWANQMPQNGDDETRLNTNDFYIRGYQFEVSAPFPLPDAIANYRTSLETEVWIPAGGSRNVPMYVVPRDLGQFLADEMTLLGVPEADVKLKIKAYGRLGDTGYYETGFVQAALVVQTDPLVYCGLGIEAICPGNIGQNAVSVTCLEP